jgi:adenylate cyclase
MIGRIRLASGLAMLSYVAMHLSNHALGLVSVDAMEWALERIVVPLWSLWPMRALLYSAFAAHYALALRALWQRRTLHLRPAEYSQLVLGFLIPILLAKHVVAIRVGGSFFHGDFGHYRYLLWLFFVGAPWIGYQQMAVLVVAWGHAMLGLHFWLRLRPWYERWQHLALIAAVLVPVLSLLGVIEAGRAAAAMAEDPAWRAAAFAAVRFPAAADIATLEAITNGLTWFFIGAVTAVLLARLGRAAWQRRHDSVRISYPNGRFIDVLRGTSVLEASRLARIPHASICGGRGRCSTCRIRVRSAPPGLPPADEAERRVLHRIGATDNVRLACQLRPHADVQVTPLLPPSAHAHDAETRVDVVQGTEREIAIVFVDIRDFTALAEGRLPYDVVFILNRYFAAMGHAVEAAGGRVDKFVGDGVMALFGVEGAADAACTEALAAARTMSQRLVELNQSLSDELAEPLRIGIGIHVGPAIVGEMGYGSATTITAVGDAVNTASRIEGLTKLYRAELVVSQEVLTRAGLDLPDLHREEIEIRGRQEKLAVAVFASARDLPDPAAVAATAEVQTSRITIPAQAGTHLSR